MNKAYMSQPMIKAMEKLIAIEFSLMPKTDLTMRALEARGYAEKRYRRSKDEHRWYPTEAGKCALFEYIGENPTLRNPPVPDS